jgi:hypothetical protein
MCSDSEMTEKRQDEIVSGSVKWHILKELMSRKPGNKSVILGKIISKVLIFDIVLFATSWKPVLRTDFQWTR